MSKLKELESEFIRSSLYGVNRQRRDVKELEPLLAAEYGAASAEKMAELKEIVEKIFAIGRDASALAASGKDEDSLEYDQLEKRTQEYREFSHAWMRKCFLEGKTNAANTENGEKTAVLDQNAIADLCNCLQNNSFKAKRDTQKDSSSSVQKTSFKQELGTILNFRTWTNDFDKMRELQTIVDGIRELDPHAGKEAQKKLTDGKEIAVILSHAFKAGGGSQQYSMTDLEKQAKKLGATKHELKRLKLNFEHGAARAKEFRAKNKDSICLAGPDYDLQGPNPFFIGNLTPSKHWTILIDETGNIFDNTYFQPEIKKDAKGRFVAILIPEGCDLPALKSFHSTESETKQVTSLLDSLLHTKIPCGILGVTLDGMANVAINYWYNGLERLIDLILRLLPVDDQKTCLDILIENRGTSQDNMVQRSADSSLYRLAKTDSVRAERFEVHAHVFSKKTTQDQKFIAYNGYVDAVACSWNGKRSELNKILKNYGLKNTCLLEGPSQNLYEIMDDIRLNRLPSPDLWSELLSSPDARKTDSLVSWLLSGIGCLLNHNIGKWKEYLNCFISHLDSKAINIRKLSKQVSFLKRYQPEEATLPPRLRLLWLTAKLAESNHRGSVVVESMKEFTSLIHDLYEEDAPLTCWATLHLAVNFTNAFEFEQANKTVEDYLKLISRATWGKTLPAWIHSMFDVLLTSLNMEPCSPAAIPGLQYYAQLISSHGQHEAFLGNNDEAVKFFAEAIRLFRKLSADDGEKDISQTSAYLLTSLMDQENPDRTLLQTTAQEYFGKNLSAAAKNLAAGKEDKDKYRQHILLRYLLSGKASDELRDAVLAEEKNWKLEYGHPWEMIEFYRALLVSDKAERMKHLKKAHELSQGYDATLHVIDAVILGSILREDPSVLAEYNDLIEQCIREIPALGDARIRTLREQPDKRLAPLELAKAVLPFNFR